MLNGKKKDFKSVWGPDPDLYARLSKPYSTKEDAIVAINRFMLGVKKLREECGISELMIFAANHHAPDDTSEGKETITIHAMTLGNSDYRAEFGALAYKVYTMPVISKGEQVVVKNAEDLWNEKK